MFSERSWIKNIDVIFMQCLKTHKEVTDMKSACRLPLRVGRSGF